ncbi:MAG: agmatinase [Ignavibacteriae bacterium]|nr:agmatinase [Ignavibacteriota bacterium]
MPVPVLPESKNFLGIPRANSSYESSRIGILSAPYEHTVSYGGGTGKGPAAILAASHYVEFWDEEYKRELCFDAGITTLRPLSFEKLRDARALTRIEDAVRRLLDDGKFAVTLGGEHTISAAPIKAHFEKHPRMSVLQFDAHSDLRLAYQGTPFSHASVMARVAEFFPPSRIVQVGIRAQCIEEYRMIEQQGIHTFFARDLHAGTHGENWRASVLDTLGDEVYITFDVDYFDPSIMPATGTPEPGGFQWDETMELLSMIGRSRRIVGFDVVELAPMRGFPFPSFLAAKLVYKMLNAAFVGR